MTPTTAAQLGALLDRDNLASGVWADAAYRSAAHAPKNLPLFEVSS
jgi:hypothetical protein